MSEGPGRAPAVQLAAAGRSFELGARPWLMGIVNASPESFTDGARRVTFEQQAELARELHAAGADILDVGGESARTDHAPIEADTEIKRVVPLIEYAAGELGAIVSVDTYKPNVARAAVAAGAAIVNDVSGLRDVRLAEVCAETGAALVLMHTLAPPGQRLQDSDRYGDITADVLAFLGDRLDAALAAGVRREQLIVDPGPDFAKTPAQTVELLRHVHRLHELARPLLLAISRKDFIGALTGRAPRERLGGTLAALEHAVRAGAHIFRLHDIDAAADFLRVRAALEGALEVSRDLALPEQLRYDRLVRPLG